MKLVGQVGAWHLVRVAGVVSAKLRVERVNKLTHWPYSAQGKDTTIGINEARIRIDVS